MHFSNVYKEKERIFGVGLVNMKIKTS